MAKRTGSKNAGTKIVILGIVFVVVLSMSVQIVRLYRKNLDLALREQSLQQQLDDEMRRADELAEYEEYLGSQEFIENEAKSKLGLIYDGEIVFREEK